MKTDRVDENMAQLLDAAVPQMSAGWEARAMERLTATRPARGLSRRLVLAAVGLAALVGLGFVPIPTGEAQGSLEKALAAMGQSSGVHLVGHLWTPVGEFDFEQWYAVDGFTRYDLYESGTLVARWLYDPGCRAVYPTKALGELMSRDQVITDHPGRGGSASPSSYVIAPLVGPGVLTAMILARDWILPPVPRSGLTASGTELTHRVEQWDNMFDLTTNETIEWSLWYGTRLVVETHGVRKDSGNWEEDGAILGDLMPPLGVAYLAGEELWIRAEISAETGDLVALTQYRSVQDKWQPVCTVDVLESGVPIASEIRDAAPLEGHAEITDHWWSDRLQDVIAVEETDDWRFTLHSLDMNRNGDLFVALSRKPKPDSPLALPVERDRLRALAVSAVDNLRATYALADHGGNSLRSPRIIEGYPEPVVFAPAESTVRLRLDRTRSCIPSGIAHTVSLMVGGGAVGWQSVTFSNIPLPPRQNTDDLFAAETEVIQY
jgi:hypothetical protein